MRRSWPKIAPRPPCEGGNDGAPKIVMTVFLFFLGLLQCLVIWMLGQGGIVLARRAQREHELVLADPPGGWPQCALIIPVAGEHPNMEPALRSLLEQDYPAFSVWLVTESRDDPAAILIGRLKTDYPGIQHLVAGQAASCGQKNHNLLAGVKAAGTGASVYVFCDSTHLAEPDFLRCLVAPLALGEAAFSTGYHQVVPGDRRTATLGYAICALFMRFLQGMTLLTQPWGGAMAMSRDAFERYDVAGLWAANVVDDCSLGAWLNRRHVQVRLCAGALLRTRAAAQRFSVWRAWLERQILFLKFCMPGQWLALGLCAIIMLAPTLWAALAILRGLMGIGGGMAPFLALCWFFLAAWAIGGWRAFFTLEIPQGAWMMAFFCSCAMFALVYAGTLFRHRLVWRDKVYQVGASGRILGIGRK